MYIKKIFTPLIIHCPFQGRSVLLIRTKLDFILILTPQVTPGKNTKVFLLCIKIASKHSLKLATNVSLFLFKGRAFLLARLKLDFAPILTSEVRLF